MKNRIKREFDRIRSSGIGGFIPFIVAGDPDLETTKKLILEIAARGANVIELGIPFSDPVADGPTIQASAQRALRHPFGIADVLELVAEVRQTGCQTPIILFSYLNPVFQFGLEKFANTAAQKGADGVLITDLIPEEAKEFQTLLADKDLCLIMLAAPTSKDERLKKICAKASGFVYAVSRTGVTGTRSDLGSEASELVSRLRLVTDLPIAVGFGISSADQIVATWKYADAAVVGSAIVAEIIRQAPDPDSAGGDLIEKIGRFTQDLLPDNRLSSE